MENLQEITITIGELQPGDKVLCSDNTYREFEIVPEHIPSDMYRLTTTHGSVDTSGDHLWTVWNGDLPMTLMAFHLFSMQPLGYAVGTPDGPSIKEIKQIEPRPVSCIQIDSEDHLFEVLTDSGEPILTHNCGFRAVAGRVGSVASTMALGNTLGTTVDSSKAGRGILQAQGKNERLQYYYAEHEYIEEWYAQRGLDSKGHPMTAETIAAGGQKAIAEGQKQKEFKPVALEDLPVAVEVDFDSVEADFDSAVEYSEEAVSKLTIEEMGIDIEIQGDSGPVGNIEL